MSTQYIRYPSQGAPGSLTGLTGDVSATGPGVATATVNAVGGQTAANVAAATILANAGTSANTPSTLVKRDGSGNFSAGTITANLLGTATSAGSFSGSLLGDVTGTQSATVVSLVGGQTAADVASATVVVGAATENNTAGTLVKRSGISGNFAAGAITATNLISPTLQGSTAALGPLTLKATSNADGGAIVSNFPNYLMTGNATAAALASGVFDPVNDDLSASLLIVNDSALSPAPAASAGLYMVGAAVAPSVDFSFIRGTFSSPTAALSNDSLGAMSFASVKSGSIYGNVSSYINIQAEENQSNTAAGSRMTFMTTTTGTLTKGLRLVIDGSNNVKSPSHANLGDNGSNNFANAYINTAINLAALTASTILVADASKNIVSSALPSSKLLSGLSNSVTLADNGTPAMDASLGNVFTLTSTTNPTIAIPSNPTADQKAVIRFVASGGSRTLALNTGTGGFALRNVTLTATASGKTDYIGCIYNSTSNKWDVIAYDKEA